MDAGKGNDGALEDVDMEAKGFASSNQPRWSDCLTARDDSRRETKRKNR